MLEVEDTQCAQCLTLRITGMDQGGHLVYISHIIKLVLGNQLNTLNLSQGIVSGNP